MTISLTPQDKAINHSPRIEAWEIYEYANGIYAHQQDWIRWYKLKDSYPVCYEFKGQTAHYIVCSNDAWITRDVALAWAKDHFAGRLRTISIDLAPCNIESKPK